MAGEIRVNASLNIRKMNAAGTVLRQDYQSRPSAFNATMNGWVGPVPGDVLVAKAGTNIDLSQLGTPGVCRFMNKDGTNNIQVGRWDPVTNRFYPFLLLKPGESFVVRLAEHIEEEYVGTGTVVGAAATTLRAKAFNAPAVLLVEAFED